MKFDLLCKRALAVEQKLKKREENVEQYDHSSSAEEAEEDYYDDDYRTPNALFGSKRHTESFSDVEVQLITRPRLCVAEGSVAYTISVDRDEDAASNTYYLDEVLEFEELRVFLVGEGNRDAVEITDDLTPEEMEIVEDKVTEWLDNHISSSNL